MSARSGGSPRGSARGRDARRVDPPYFDTVRARRLARFVAETAPEGLRGYVEPYLDGGAAALAVLQRHPDASITLASTLDDLVASWEAVRDEPEELIGAVRLLAEGHGPAQFAAVRDAVGRGEDGAVDAAAWAGRAVVERAARFIYLRGVAATDAQGAPLRETGAAVLGREAVVFDEANIRALSALLRRSDVTVLRVSPFGLLPRVQDEDLVYLDTAVLQASGANPREVRSLVGAVTARGAFAVAAAELDGLAVVHDELWGSGNLRRALARQAAEQGS